MKKIIMSALSICTFLQSAPPITFPFMVREGNSTELISINRATTVEEIISAREHLQAIMDSPEVTVLKVLLPQLATRSTIDRVFEQDIHDIQTPAVLDREVALFTAQFMGKVVGYASHRIITGNNSSPISQIRTLFCIARDEQTDGGIYSLTESSKALFNAASRLERYPLARCEPQRPATIIQQRTHDTPMFIFPEM